MRGHHSLGPQVRGDSVRHAVSGGDTMLDQLTSSKTAEMQSPECGPKLLSGLLRGLLACTGNRGTGLP